MQAHTVVDDAKQRAIEQWSTDPCGANSVDREPGSRDYFVDLVAARHAYAPWLDAELAYDACCGLDVLDVGCGQGVDVYRYAKAGANATGIDLTRRHVELARAHLSAMGLTATIVEGDSEGLPFPDASFDRVSSMGVLHHTPDIAAALREIHRVLRPGGEACVVVYNQRSLHYWLHQFAYHGLLRRQLFEERSMAGVLSRNVEYSTIGARPLVNVYRPGQMRLVLDRAGFVDAGTVVRHFHLHDTPLTAPLRRLEPFRSRRFLDAVGRAAGWYVIARGRRSTA